MFCTSNVFRYWTCTFAKSVTAARCTRKQCLHFNSYSMSHRLSDVLDSWTLRFQELSIPDARSSAEFIIAHLKSLKTLHNVDIFGTELGKEEKNEIDQLCQLRLKRMPVQYIIKEWDFDGLTFKMRPPVFIPRPETEELVQNCKSSLVEALESTDEQCPAFVDIGCGCGTITLALLHKFKKVRAVAVDVSPLACQLTRENAAAIGVDDRLTVMEGSIKDDNVLEQLKARGPFSLLISNPPYLKAKEIPELEPEITQYEDHGALDGGQDGLDLVTHILKIASLLVFPHCDVWIEVRDDHPEIIHRLSESQTFPGLRYEKTVKDMFGKDRYCHLHVKG